MLTDADSHPRQEKPAGVGGFFMLAVSLAPISEARGFSTALIARSATQIAELTGR
jgi:hypothetical protein